MVEFESQFASVYKLWVQLHFLDEHVKGQGRAGHEAAGAATAALRHLRRLRNIIFDLSLLEIHLLKLSGEDRFCDITHGIGMGGVFGVEACLMLRRGGNIPERVSVAHEASRQLSGPQLLYRMNLFCVEGDGSGRIGREKLGIDILKYIQ